mgnify:CR=1 FL=1
MNETEPLSEKVERIEARCLYLGLVCTSLLRSLPDKNVFLKNLELEKQMHDANSLYATSLSDSQRQVIQAALEALEALEALVRALAPDSTPG